MADYLSGGQSRVDFYRVDGTNEDLLVIKDGAFTSTATDTTDIAHSLTLLEQSQFQFQEDGTVNVTLTNYEDTETLADFLEDVLPDPTTLTGAPEFKLETGQKLGGSTGGKDKLVLAVFYGAQTGTTAVTDKMKTITALGNLKATSGSFTQKADEWSKPQIEFAGTKATSLLTVATGLYASSSLSITVTDPVVFSKNQCYKVKFFPKA